MVNRDRTSSLYSSAVPSKQRTKVRGFLIPSLLLDMGGRSGSSEAGEAVKKQADKIERTKEILKLSSRR